MGEEGETQAKWLTQEHRGKKKTNQKPARKKIVLYFVPEKWRPLELLGGLLSTGATAGWMMGAILR